jgi:hypothetical protein
MPNQIATIKGAVLSGIIAASFPFVSSGQEINQEAYQQLFAAIGRISQVAQRAQPTRQIKMLDDSGNNFVKLLYGAPSDGCYPVGIIYELPANLRAANMREGLDIHAFGTLPDVAPYFGLAHPHYAFDGDYYKPVTTANYPILPNCEAPPKID